jgi:hypothetical protein
VQRQIKEREDGLIDFLNINLHGSHLRDLIELVGRVNECSSMEEA